MKKQKVILISGFTGGRRDLWMFKKVLKDFEIIYFNYNTELYQPIEEIANELWKFIDKLKLLKNEKVSLIGISAGGNIAEYYVKFLDKQKVNKIATICSPIKGSYLPKFFSKKREGLVQLQSGSSFIKKLNKKKSPVRELNIWCYLDPLVPGKCGKGESENSIQTLMFFHWAVGFYPPIIKKVSDFLEG